MTGRVAGYRHGRVPRAIRVQQLLDAAETLFVEHGYSGFKIEQLCRSAGVSRPVVYEHFGSKDGIYLACLRRLRAEFEQTLVARASEGTDIETVLRKAAEAYFTALQRDPRRWAFVFGANAGTVGSVAEAAFELRAATVARLAVLFQGLAPQLDAEMAEALVYAASGAGEMLGQWWLRNQHIPVERMVRHLTDFCARGVAGLVVG
jgi:AcrR family transcriptional regulator